MAVQLPPEMAENELMSKSVMDEPRSGFQRLRDFLVGRTLGDQWTGAFTGVASGLRPTRGYSAHIPGMTEAIHKKFGGSSITRAGENLSGRPGYAVSTVKNAEQVLDHPPTAAEISAYLKQNRKALAENPDLFVGTWEDQGKHYLDLSQHVPNRETAVQLGRQHKQKAIHNLETHENENVPVRLTRYMRNPPGAVLDPSDENALAKLRSSHGGQRLREGGAPRRLYYYDLEAGPPEYGIRGGRYRVQTEIDPEKVYNLATDPSGLKTRYRGQPNAMEAEIRRQGFSGYYNPDLESSGGLPHVYAIFERMPVKQVE